MDAKKTELLEALIKAKGIVTKACEAIGSPRSTYYLWYNSDDEFKKEADSINDVVLDFAEGKLFDLVNNGDTTATIFLLKTRGKNRGYVEKSQTDMNLTGGVTVNLVPTPGCDPIKDEQTV